MKRSLQVAALLLLSAGIVCRSHAAALSVGMPAPKLASTGWVQGEPVNEFEKGKAYIVEFWATWCGPCVDAIPHLNKLHEKFKDRGLVVIGQNVWENNTNAVKPFIKKMGANMTYRVALDTTAKAMAKTWMEAAGRTGIPASFLVDTHGDLVWIGHPAGLDEKLIERVLKGELGKSQAMAEQAEREKGEARINEMWERLGTASRAKDGPGVDRALNDLEAYSPDMRKHARLVRFQMAAQRNDAAAVSALAEEISQSRGDEPMVMNQLAWTILTDPNLTGRNVALAERLARSAAAKTSSSNPEILDTLARAVFMQGRKDEAVTLQAKAVEQAEGRRKIDFARNLRDYKAGKLPNEQKLQELRRKLQAALEKREWQAAEASLAELEPLLLEEEASSLDSVRFRIAAGRGQEEAAAKLARQLAAASEAMQLNEIAWSMAIDEKASPLELRLAEVIARGADKATDGKNPEILDTLARVLFRTGAKDQAIQVQARSVELAKGDRKEQFAATLKSYKEGSLPSAN